MKAILILVTSLDGKITKWGDHHIRSWSSQFDQDHFDAVWKDTRVIIMGSATYTADPVFPEQEHMFIVMTRHPARFREKEKPGRLEFSNDPPQHLINRFEKEGEERILVVGGAQIATLFLRNKLIDELWLTLEPKIFGTGGNFVTEEKLDIELKLISILKANAGGTLLTKYEIINKI